MSLLLQLIGMLFGFRRYRNPQLGPWPLILSNGQGTWIIYCSPTMVARHKRGVLLVLLMTVVTWFAFTQVRGGGEFWRNFVSLLFGSWERLLITFTLAYLLASLTFIPRFFVVTPGRIRHHVVRTVRFDDPHQIGITASQDAADQEITHLMAQWGLGGLNQQVLGSFRGSRLYNTAAKARIALLVALNDGKIERMAL